MADAHLVVLVLRQSTQGKRRHLPQLTLGVVQHLDQRRHRTPLDDLDLVLDVAVVGGGGELSEQQCRLPPALVALGGEQPDHGLQRALIQHPPLDVVRRVHQVTDDTHGFVVNVRVVGPDHEDEHGQRTLLHDLFLVLVVLKRERPQRRSSRPLNLGVPGLEQRDERRDATLRPYPVLDLVVLVRQVGHRIRRPASHGRSHVAAHLRRVPLEERHQPGEGTRVGDPVLVLLLRREQPDGVARFFLDVPDPRRAVLADVLGEVEQGHDGLNRVGADDEVHHLVLLLGLDGPGGRRRGILGELREGPDALLERDEHVPVVRVLRDLHSRLVDHRHQFPVLVKRDERASRRALHLVVAALQQDPQRAHAARLARADRFAEEVLELIVVRHHLLHRIRSPASHLVHEPRRPFVSLPCRRRRVAGIRLRQVQHPDQRRVGTRVGDLRPPGLLLLLLVLTSRSEQHGERGASLLVQLGQRPRLALLPNLVHSAGVELPNLLALVRVLALLAVAQTLVRAVPRTHLQRLLQRLRRTRLHQDIRVVAAVPTELAHVPRPPLELIHGSIVRPVWVHRAVLEHLGRLARRFRFGVQLVRGGDVPVAPLNQPAQHELVLVEGDESVGHSALHLVLPRVEVSVQERPQLLHHRATRGGPGHYRGLGIVRGSGGCR